eukprot:scaffold54_cov110-Cylindrotheca_fusiformis.AAC.4
MISEDFMRVVACVIRRDASIDLGITFRQDVVNGCLVIDTIAANGLFANTGLKLDMQLVKINGHRCYRISKRNLDKTETILKQAVGIVTIEVQSPQPVVSNEPTITERQIFTIQKATKSFQLGLGFEKIQTPEDSLRIVKLSPTFEKVLGIRKGLQVVRINGAPCDVDDIASVHEQMKQAYPLLCLECIATVKNEKREGTKENPTEQKKVEEIDENLRVVACIVRPNADLDLGITFRRDEENGFLIINSVSKDGFFAGTGLKPNLRVVKINGHRISRKRMDQAVELLQQAKGLITIEAEASASKDSEEHTVSERQIFSIQKATKSFKLELGLERIQTPDDTLRIVKVSPTFQKVLGLKQGLELRKINGVACNVHNLDSVQEQMSHAYPMLTMECMATVVNRKAEVDEDDENIRVVACIVRPNSNVDLGITYHADVEKGCLVVDSVQQQGLFARTGVKAKQYIVKINGKRIAPKNLSQAVDLLKQITGRVTLETVSIKNPDANHERRFFSIEKTSKNFQLGLGLGALQLPEESAPSLRILEVSPTFQKVLGLRPGLQLLKVNGLRCNLNDIPSVHTEMDHAFPMLSLECIATIIQKKKDDEKPAVDIREISVSKEETKDDDNIRVVACVMRPDASVDLGISFTKDFANGSLLIDSLANDSIFANTGLQSGQKIVKINGKKTPKRRLDQAVESMQKAQGRITIEAEFIKTGPQSGSERQIFSIQKANKSFSLGLGLGLEQTDSTPLLRIVKASPTLERVLGLKQGLQLLKINGVPCNLNDIQSVNKQMDEAFPILSLECVAKFKPVEMKLHRVDSDLTEAVSADSRGGTASVEEEEESKRAMKEKAAAEEEARLKAVEEERKKAEEEARLAAEAKAKEEARIKAEEEARIKAEEEARIQAEEEARLKAEEEARLRAEEEARLKAEEEARLKAEEEARLKAEEETRIAAEAAEAAKLKAEEEAMLAAKAEEARLKAEEEAKAKAEEEARLEAEAKAQAEEAARQQAEEMARAAAAEAEEARIKAEEEARLAAEAEAARLRAEEESRLKAEAEAKARAEAEAQAQARAEEEARRQAEEEARLKAIEEARLKAEAEAKAAEEARLKAIEEARLKAEAEAKAAEEARLKAKEDARLKAEEEARLKAEEEARLKAEAKAKAQAEEEARWKAEEEARLKAEEEFRQRVEEAARRQAEQEAKEQAQEANRLKAYRESKLRVEEEARLWEEASKQAEKEANIAAEEERKRAERREKRLSSSRESQRMFGEATGGGSGFGFFSSGLGDPLIKVKEKKADEDELLLTGSSAVTGVSDIDEVDDLIRAAEERQAKIERELLDLAWD